MTIITDPRNAKVIALSLGEELDMANLECAMFAKPPLHLVERAERLYEAWALSMDLVAILDPKGVGELFALDATFGGAK
jgi:hypothetical protein